MRKLGFITIGFYLTLFLSFNSYSQKSPRRGYGYGQNSTSDMAVMSKGNSWWYNWYYEPEATVASYFKSLGIEFVPMVWGGTPNADNLVAKIPEGAKYLLGFNEPNFGDQANMTPQQAASLWPILEDIAKRRNLKIVGPAVNYCGGNCNQTDPIQWLKDFFAACPNCQVDYIALHWYACTGPGLTGFLDSFRQFGKPIWLTEFSCGESWAYSLQGQTKYMYEALTILETDPDIFRYAWFAGRSTAIPNVNLLGNNGQLTSLGKLYNDFPVGGLIFSVPGRVEAENMSLMKGVTNEACSDAGAGFDVGFTDAGDWMEYKIDVKKTETYQFDFRIASGGTTAGKLRVLVDGNQVIGSTTINVTGGWQTWNTVTVKDINLTAGSHNLRVLIDDGGFNVNYINITSQTTPDCNGVLNGVAYLDNCGICVGGNTGKSACTGVTPYSGTPIYVPGIVEAENYDKGGQNLSYLDMSAGNEGGAYRTDDVDIQACNDVGGGYNIGWTENGEFLSYTIDVAATGFYDFKFRLAAPNSNGVLHAEIDGLKVTGNVSIPASGGWQTWSTVTVSKIKLTAGLHTLKLVFDLAAYNVNYLEIKPAIVSGQGELNGEYHFSYYPNPFTGELKIEVQEPSEVIKLELIDLLGRTWHVKEGKEIENGFLKIGEELASGSYLLRIIYRNSVVNRVVVKK